ncbi:hypothetical protein EV363DRAFT_1315920 [Boletus edulis]|uniref:DUF4336 domain-containing protein n=1 Tax=Boletus edulis BED1 TaxID=1328754 RepID=A0AAD4GBJ7_BOLED|nr:hypothetical protein EV363DRAFT_1362114 [Boletus edulis]KAF8136925.1 hypothetical protein EV363DRAFT_1315920 [Boletus edulis]KAF8434792.1 hypothetical protein L210DRAFT_3552370 [Boletus edulis BED1]
MGDTIIREVVKDVWTFSRPFARYGVFPIGGRSTAVRLRDGGVWVLASTLLDYETKTKINELGPVKYIINPDIVHHLYLLEFKMAYPNAKVIGVEDTVKRMNEKSFPFDGLWGRDPPNTQYGFEQDIKHCYFSGVRNKEVAFLHVPSRSLIQADLLFNLPATEQYSRSSKWIPRATLKPDSWAHQKVIQGVATDVEAVKRDAKTVASWDFDRIIPCHGDVIERGGNKAWRSAYQFFID